ncbi:MAG: 50S ribosomal protein L21 [Minisyncoccia bacterium]|jgi:large subunit ribosomal protein L21
MATEFAIIQTGGKQYKVSVGQKLKVEKLLVETGIKIAFDKVLLQVAGDKVTIGMPNIAGAKVEANVLQQAREDTKIVFKYHSKARYKKKKGHRQPFTEVEIVKVT